MSIRANGCTTCLLGWTAEIRATDGTSVGYTYTDGYESGVPFLQTTVTNARR